MKMVTDALKLDRFYNFIDKLVTTTQFSRKTLGSGLESIHRVDQCWWQHVTRNEERKCKLILISYLFCWKCEHTVYDTTWRVYSTCNSTYSTHMQVCMQALNSYVCMQSSRTAYTIVFQTNMHTIKVLLKFYTQMSLLINI